MLAFDRYATTYNSEALLQKQVAKRLATLLEPNTYYSTMYEFGCGTGFLTEALLKRIHVNEIVLNDLSPRMLNQAVNTINHILEQQRIACKTHQGDAEQIPIPQSDLIVSASALQWIKHPFDFLQRCIQQLKPNGTLLFSTFGKKNLWQLRKLTGMGLEYPSIDAYRSFLAEEHLTSIHIESWQQTLYFPSAKHILLHLKRTGVTVLPLSHKYHTTLSPKEIKKLTNDYENLFRTSRGVAITYQPILCYATKDVTLH